MVYFYLGPSENHTFPIKIFVCDGGGDELELGGWKALQWFSYWILWEQRIDIFCIGELIIWAFWVWELVLRGCLCVISVYMHLQT